MGRKVRIICTDREDPIYTIVALVKDNDRELEILVTYTKDGIPAEYNEAYYTLFFAPEKPKVERFDMNTLQPFDKILARNSRDEIWSIARGLFSNWCYVIPFNEETKHLVGTRDDCPEYYKWWEE